MEQTLLERTIEDSLKELGIPLYERAYAEDLDFQADIEDATTETKSTDPRKVKFLASLHDQLYEEQVWRGQQPFLIRNSQPFFGLGFQYVIEASKHGVGIEGKSAKEIANQVILQRDFGETGSEILKIYYNFDSVWRLDTQSPRFRMEQEQKLYRDYSNLVFNFEVLPDNKTIVDNRAKEEDYFRCQNIRDSLEGLESTFQGVIFNEQHARVLSQYFQELVRTVDPKYS